MEAPERVWDAWVASTLLTPSTTGSSASLTRTCRLRLRRDPERLYSPTTPRSPGQIAPPLRDAIRGAVRGELPWPLAVLGAAGTGKTCAGLCLLDLAGGLYFTAADLAQQAVEAMKGQLVSPWTGERLTLTTLWQNVAATKLLVLDELGTRGQVTDHHYDCVKRALDEREGKPMLALSNETLTRLKAIYDDRVASRLAAGTVIRLDGEDRRIRRNP